MPLDPFFTIRPKRRLFGDVKVEVERMKSLDSKEQAALRASIFRKCETGEPRTKAEKSYIKSYYAVGRLRGRIIKNRNRLKHNSVKKKSPTLCYSGFNTVSS